ncbi:MAG: hypothetical protein AB7D51_12075 [Desulfovibrionaceae bacterium]
MKFRMLKYLLLACALVVTVGAAAPAQALTLGFEAGLNDDGTFAIINTSTRKNTTITSVTIDFAKNTTFFNTDSSSPGGSTWEAFNTLGTAAATSPDSAATDGSQTATFSFSGLGSTVYSSSLYGFVRFDLDSTALGDSGQVYGGGDTFITVTFSNGDSITARFYTDSTHIEEDFTYSAMGVISTTPIPPSALLLAPGLLGLVGLRRLRG